MEKVTTYRIALCGPGDVQKEIGLATEVISKWNQLNFDGLNCGLKADHWKTDVVPSMEERGQAAIDRKIIDGADVLVAIFWQRLGTPTGMFDSGTAEEVIRAMSQGKPVLLYFSDIENTSPNQDPHQQEMLTAFRNRAMASGLPWTFKSRRQFGQLFEAHLNSTVLGLIIRRKPKKTVNQVKKDRGPIRQKAQGSNNLQVAGDGNTIHMKVPRPPKISITPPPGSLTPADQHQIGEWIKELSSLLEEVENKSVALARSELWSRLKNQFRVSKYEQIESSRMQEVKSWYQTVKAEFVRDARTKAPNLFSSTKITAIKAAMNRMGRKKEDYYPEIARRLRMQTFTSLKILSGKNLDRVCNLVQRDANR